MRTTSVSRAAGLCAALALLVAPAFAQPVYVANSSNGRINVFDVEGHGTLFAGDTSSLAKPLGIVLDGTGGLVVCDNQRGRIVRYDASGAGPAVLASDLPRPDGPSLGQGGDIFFVTSPDGANSTKLRDVYVLPAGSGPAVKIAYLDDSRLLRHTAVVPVGPYAGDLLVLSSKPAFIARFSMEAPGSFTRQPNFVSSLLGEPTGMAFTSSGDLLVSGIEGVIRRFDSSGNALSDFASGLGAGPTRIAIGADGTVYVTNRTPPSVLRFDAAGMRLANLSGGLQSPAGVAVPGLAPTPVGTNVTVTPIPGVTVTFDNVAEPGFTTGVRTYLEPGQRTTPCGNVIPDYLDLPAGDTRFVIIRLDTTAFFTDSILTDILHPDGNSRAFHAACPPGGSSGTPLAECPPIVEGFSDATVLAVPGDPRSRVPTFSEFVVVTDTRPNGVVIWGKFEALWSTVAPGSPAEQAIPEATLWAIRGFIARTSWLIFIHNYAGAIEELQNLKDYVRANSGTTIPNNSRAYGGNIAGTLLSQAATLTFSLSLEL